MISDIHLKNICKIGQGKDCCRYIICSTTGFQCAKLTSLKDKIDKKVKSMSAQSDNCEGILHKNTGDL